MTEPVFINIGGKNRVLRYDINAAVDIEKLLGESLLGVIGNPEKIGFHVILVLLWGGLKHAEKGLTEQRVGLWMQEYLEAGSNLEDLVVAIGEAMQKSKLTGSKRETEEEVDEGNGTFPPSQHG